MQAGIKVLLIVVVILIVNPILTHATAHAATLREAGQIRLDPNEKGDAH